MKTVNQQTKLNYNRFAYNDLGMPITGNCQFQNFEFIYQMALKENDKEKIKVINLNKYPYGYCSIKHDDQLFDLITYDQDSIDPSINCFDYALLIIETYLNKLEVK
jgi:hypothetical protein